MKRTTVPRWACIFAALACFGAFVSGYVASSRLTIDASAGSLITKSVTLPASLSGKTISSVSYERDGTRSSHVPSWIHFDHASQSLAILPGIDDVGSHIINVHVQTEQATKQAEGDRPEETSFPIEIVVSHLELQQGHYLFGANSVLSLPYLTMHDDSGSFKQKIASVILAHLNDVSRELDLSIDDLFINKWGIRQDNSLESEPLLDIDWQIRPKVDESIVDTLTRVKNLRESLPLAFNVLLSQYNAESSPAKLISLENAPLRFVPAEGKERPLEFENMRRLKDKVSLQQATTVFEPTCTFTDTVTITGAFTCTSDTDYPVLPTVTSSYCPTTDFTSTECSTTVYETVTTTVCQDCDPQLFTPTTTPIPAPTPDLCPTRNVCTAPGLIYFITNRQQLEELCDCEEINGYVYIYNANDIFSLDCLSRVVAIRGGLIMDSNPHLISLETSALKLVTDSIIIFNNPYLTVIDFPELKTVGFGGLVIVFNPQVTLIEVPRVVEIFGSLIIAGNQYLDYVDFRSLVGLGGLLFFNANTALSEGDRILFPSLQFINVVFPLPQGVVLENMPLEVLPTFPVLQVVVGDFRLSFLDLLYDADELANLQDRCATITGSLVLNELPSLCTIRGTPVAAYDFSQLVPSNSIIITNICLV